MPTAEVVLQLQNQASPALKQTASDAQALAAALSREALATGDVNAALRQMDAALRTAKSATSDGTAKTLAAARAEAALAVAVGDRAGGITILETELARQAERTTAVIGAERQLTAIENQSVAATQREIDADIRLSQQRARAATASKDHAGALTILQSAQASSAGGSAQVVAGLETQIATTEAAGSVTGAFGAHLSSLVSPLALVAGGIAIATKVVTSFGDALHIAGQLQEERTAFGGIIGDFAKGNAVLDEAIGRNRAYGFTTKETTDAFRDLAPIIRESTSSTADQADALARISVLKPDAPVQALTSAIEGIKTGRFRELSKELGLSAAEQKNLKTQVDGGKDAFLALNDVLDQHGITLKVASERMDGYAGAERRAALAEEDLQKAQAGFAAGPGLVILQARTALTSDATRLLSGDVRGLNDALKDSGISAVNPLIGVMQSYNSTVLNAGRGALVWAGAIKDGGPSVARLKDDTVDLAIATQASASALDADAKKKLDETIATAGLAEKQRDLDRDSQLAASGMLGAGDQAKLLAQKYGIAADQAQFLIDKQRGVSQAMGALIDEQTKHTQVLAGDLGVGAPALAGSQNNTIEGVLAVAEAQKKAADDAKKLTDAQIQNQLINAQTSAQKIAILQKEKDAETDPLKRQELQNQIDQERVSAAKAHTGELRTQLNLHESIFDSLNKQRDAQLSIEELQITGRQQDRADQAKIKTAQAILGSSSASADFKARARDALDLIGVQERQRAQALSEKGATAGGAIIGGKVYQSSAGGGLPPSGGAGPLSSRPGGTALPSAGGAGGGAAGPLTINLVVDGKILASVSEPYIMDALLKAVRGARATQGA